MKTQKKTTKNKKQKAGGIISMVIILLIGFAAGWLVTAYADRAGGADTGSGAFLIRLLYLVFCIYLAFFLQGAVHEAGHLICGLLSGYGFASYRIGSLMWIKQDGKIRFKRFSIAGTGGQCLMTPPELTEEGMRQALEQAHGPEIAEYAGTLLVARSGEVERWVEHFLQAEGEGAEALQVAALTAISRNRMERRADSPFTDEYVRGLEGRTWASSYVMMTYNRLRLLV